MLVPACVAKNSRFSGIDPRVKLVAIFGFVAVVSSLASKPLLVIAAGLVIGLSLFSGLGAGSLLRRIALVIPFAGVVLSFSSLWYPGSLF